MKLSQNSHADEDDMFEDLINYSGEQTVHTIPKSKRNITFLEPNKDLLDSETYINLNNETIKELMSNSLEYEINPNDYILKIVEQPEQCRVSSSGEKDRRPIDPAPIIKLLIPSNDTIESIVECPFYIIHASLWSIDLKTQYDLIENDGRVMAGSLVATPSLLKDLNDEKAYYFAFPDLSIKITGQFRLKFSLIHIVSNNVIKDVVSDPFIVYSSKSYPGMKESSALSRHLAKQGLKLTIRTQLRPKKKQ